MKTIKIVSSNDFCIRRQIPKSIINSNEVKFTFNEDVNCDYCFVFDEVNYEFSVSCPKRNLILCLGEPKHVKIYPRSYIRQFGRVASFYKIKGIENISINHPLLPWMAGISFDVHKKEWIRENVMTYDDFTNSDTHDRLNKLAIITSNKAFSKGHKERLNFVLRLKENLGDLLDIYGDGFVPVEDKYNILRKYKYCLVIENCRIQNYWTEKLADSILSGCYTFYNGCTNINSFFNNACINTFELNDVKTVSNKIRDLISNNIYENCLVDINKAKKEILNKYNIVTSLINFIQNDRFQSESNIICEHKIRPIQFRIIDKLKTKFNRLFY